MKIFIVSCLWAVFAVITSCQEKELSIQDAARMSAEFPELDADMPEEDHSLQKRSAKRGMCTLFLVEEMPLLMSEGVSWCYNWGHSTFNADRIALLKDVNIEFLPMSWSLPFNIEDLVVHYENGSGYILGYNEPNLKDQANMTPKQAAKGWPELVSAAKTLGMKLVGPAVNYGTLEGYGDPVVWYDEFLSQPGVSIDDIDAIALHCYMPNGNAVKSLMIRKFAKYGKPLWLTEFANGDARTPEQQATFMQEAVTYLEADPAVERYAWFMDTIHQPAAPHFPLVTGPEVGTSPTPELTDLGRLYTYMSSFDKETAYPVDHNIPAECYSGQVIEDSASKDAWGPVVATRITSDMAGNLEIYGLKKDTWVEYRINLPATSKYRIDLRYSSSKDAMLLAEVAGAPNGIFEMSHTTSGEWTTSGFEMALPKGEHTLRLTVMEGEPVLNWLCVTSPME